MTRVRAARLTISGPECGLGGTAAGTGIALGWGMTVRIPTAKVAGLVEQLAQAEHHPADKARRLGTLAEKLAQAGPAAADHRLDIDDLKQRSYAALEAAAGGPKGAAKWDAADLARVLLNAKDAELERILARIQGGDPAQALKV